MSKFDGDETCSVTIVGDAEEMLAARGLKVMAAHEGDSLPPLVQRATTRLGRTIGLMLADLHMVKSPDGGGDGTAHIVVVEQLFAGALRQGLAMELAEHRRRRAEAKLDEPEGWA